MMPKIDVTGDGITLSMKVDGEYEPFVTCDSVGVQLQDYIADAIDATHYLYGVAKRDYLGEFDKKEEIDMNKVLELYAEREEKRIRDKYNQLEIDKYESEPIVVEFNEIEKNIKSAYDDLIKKYNVDGNELITKTGYEYEPEFELSESIIANIRDVLQPQFDAEITELNNKVKDIEALLSISDDKDYQLEVLKNYGLLDKKGNIVR